MAHLIGIYLIIGMVIGTSVVTKTDFLNDDSKWKGDLSYKERLMVTTIIIPIVTPLMPIAFIAGIIKKYL